MTEKRKSVGSIVAYHYCRHRRRRRRCHHAYFDDEASAALNLMKNFAERTSGIARYIM